MSEVHEQLQATLGSGYRVVREIGGGGMSRVFVAEDLSLGRTIAVKVLHPEQAASVSIERFHREIQVAAQLQHPLIVPLLAAGETGGLPFYTMPFVEGESLRAKIAREGALPLGEALRLMFDVAKALAYAHRHGVVHRDIKPENILISDGSGLVADFGVAKAMNAARRDGEALTSAGLSVGTPMYMAPEQVAADPSADQRVDLYALGAVAYEMFAGRQLFQGRSPQSVFVAHLTQIPAPLQALRPDVPAVVAAIVMRCLEKDPDRRPQSAEEILHAVEEVTTPGGATQSAAGVSVDTSKHRLRRQLLGGTVMGTLAVLISLALFTPRGVRASMRTLLTRKTAALDARRVVVAPFENQTGDSTIEFLGNMAADWIAQGLARTGAVDVVDARTVLIASKVVEKTPRLLRTRNDARAIAEETGAATVVSGSLYRDGDSLRFQAVITDVQSGRVIRAVDPVSGTAHGYSALIRLLGRETMAALATVVDTTRHTWAVSLGQPPSFEAYQELMRSLDRYLLTDSLGAFTHLRRAIALDSTWMSPLVFEAYLLTDLGAYELADTIARRIEPHRDRLGLTETAFLDYVNAAISGDPEVQLQTAWEAARASPGSTEVPLLTARIALELYRPKEALAALARVDPERGASLATNLYWELSSNAYHELGEFDRALAEAQEGLRRVPDDRTAANDEMVALAALGRAEDINDRLLHVTSRWQHPRFAYQLARLAISELYAHLRDEEMALVMPVALRVTEPAARDSSLRAQQMRGEVLYFAQRYTEAQALFSRASERDTTNVSAAGWLGVSAARAGDARLASAVDRRLARWPRKYDLAAASFMRARLAAIAGDRPRAVALLTQALSEGQRFRAGGVLSDFHSAPEFRILRGDLAFEELMQVRK